MPRKKIVKVPTIHVNLEEEIPKLVFAWQELIREVTLDGQMNIHDKVKLLTSIRKNYNKLSDEIGNYIKILKVKKEYTHPNHNIETPDFSMFKKTIPNINREAKAV